MQVTESEAVSRVSIVKVFAEREHEQFDEVSVEQPLEIRLAFGQSGEQKNISVTMRTPGNDDELAAGFLFTEGVINSGGQVESIKTIAENATVVCLFGNTNPVLKNTDRNFYTTSSCGVCGKASIDSIVTVSPFQSSADNIVIDKKVFGLLRSSLSQQQQAFTRTGGLHAAALFDVRGNFIRLREDVGRHNALDKLIGGSLLSNDLPLSRHILLLSGRASFELIQKAAMAGIKIVAAIGAPSSLAVELAEKSGMTLIGFLRESQFNVYSGIQRIRI